jgi:hypothetical protein
VERAIDLLSRTILLDIVSRRDADAVVKSQAESMVRQIDDKYRQRGKGESP